MDSLSEETLPSISVITFKKRLHPGIRLALVSRIYNNNINIG